MKHGLENIFTRDLKHLLFNLKGERELVIHGCMSFKF